MKNIYIAIPIVFLLLILLKKFKPKKPIQNKNLNKMDSENLFNDLVKFVLRMEGGLTADKADSASKFPSPTKELYHTNKGITYKTFIDSAKVLNFNPSTDNFLKMPSDIWLKIFKEKYYNKTKTFTDNEVLNSYLSLWYWGGWYLPYMPIKIVADLLAKPISNKEKLKGLTELRKIYFDKVIAANPKNKKFEKGWKNRADEFYTEFEKYL